VQGCLWTEGTRWECLQALILEELACADTGGGGGGGKEARRCWWSRAAAEAGAKRLVGRGWGFVEVIIDEVEAAVAVVEWWVGVGVGGVGVCVGVGAGWRWWLGWWWWKGVGVAGVVGRGVRVVGRLGVIGLDGAMEAGEARARCLEVEELCVGFAFGSGAQVLELVAFIGVGVVELVGSEVVLLAAEDELGEARVAVGEVGLEAGAAVEEA
jgi:hypothetical protein